MGQARAWLQENPKIEQLSRRLRRRALATAERQVREAIAEADLTLGEAEVLQAGLVGREAWAPGLAADLDELHGRLQQLRTLHTEQRDLVEGAGRGEVEVSIQAPPGWKLVALRVEVLVLRIVVRLLLVWTAVDSKGRLWRHALYLEWSVSLVVVRVQALFVRCRSSPTPLPGPPTATPPPSLPELMWPDKIPSDHAPFIKP